MTITATANPLDSPPTVAVAMSVTPGSTMSSISVYRNDSSGRSLLRSQPSAGFDSRTVTDYECPYGEPVTYDWAAAYTTGYSTLWNETWASFASWTTTFGSFNVSASNARNTATATSYAYRAFAPSKGRITIGSLTTTTGTEQAIVYVMQSAVADTTAPYIAVWYEQASGLVKVSIPASAGGSPVSTTIDHTAPITVDILDTTVRISGTGGSATLSYNLTPASVRVVAASAVSANNIRFGAIKVEAVGSSATIAQTTAPVQLDPADAWLIHPGTPGLSIPLSNTDQSVAGIKAIAPVANNSTATVHRILGSATPIPTTTGPRADDTVAMTVWTNSTAERAALRALLASDIPILIQIPPDWETDFNCGFYSVGDLNEIRDSDQVRFSNSTRTFELPLIKVQSPVVDVENSGWSYAAVASEFATYAALLVTFGTYADLASDTRR